MRRHNWRNVNISFTLISRQRKTHDIYSWIHRNDLEKTSNEFYMGIHIRVTGQFQGKNRLKVNTFCAHRIGLFNRRSKGSVIANFRALYSLNSTSNASSGSTLWPVLIRCLAIEDAGARFA